MLWVERGFVYLTQREIERIARLILKQIRSAGVGVPDDGKLVAAVVSLIHENIEEERRLEGEALKLLKKYGQAGGAGLDQEKALRMIKQKLADERKFVL